MSDFARRIADAIGSLWFGITLMVLLFVYAWLGSAGTAPFYEWFVRQTFEKTEMEWFAWWPLHVLIGLLALSLVVVTVRKIPFTLATAGVWAVHAGVLVLLLGAVIYFGNKVEGDVLVARRAAVLQAGAAPVGLPLQADAEAVVPAADGRSYHVRVADLNPHYTLLTGEDAGKTAYAAQLMVQPLEAGGQPGEPFVRQVLVGYPQFTEDVLPGRGRAVKVLGKPLVDETLQVTLEYAPSDRIFLANRAALHVRVAGGASWAEYPLPDLPRYHEYVGSWDDVWSAPGAPLPEPEPLDLRPAAQPGAPAALADVRLRVTGFLPFAVLQERVEPAPAAGAGAEPASGPPYARVSVELGEQVFTEALLAGDPHHGTVTLGEDLFDLRFAWLDDPAELERWLHPPTPTVALRVPALAAERVVTLSELMAGPIEVEGTGYTVEGLRVVPKWTVADEAGAAGEDASMVLVRVRGPEQTFVRAVVYPQFERSRDIPSARASARSDPSARASARSDDESGQSHPGLVDDDVEVVVRDLPWPGMTVVAGAVGLHVLMHNLAGEVRHGEVRIGEPLPFFDGETAVTVLEVAPASRRHVRPAVIPERERDLKAGQLYSLVQVEAARGDQVTRGWLRYSHYAHPNRMGFHPQRLELPGGPPIEVVYSRETQPLPTAVALEDFRLETYPGRDRERDYVSLVRFREGDAWSAPHEVRSNQPTEHDGWWYFQATWDPPEPRLGYGGMSFTGLGVGNRHGVGVMLLGGLLTVLGTLWAFYAKPFVLRSRLRRLRDAADTGGAPDAAERPDRRRHGVAAALGLLVLMGLVASAAAAERQVTLSVGAPFAEALDLSTFRLLAVQDEGRVKTVDSLARETLKLVNASREARAIDPVLLYLDMALAPAHHRAAPGIYIRKKVLVQQLVRSIQGLVPPAHRAGVLSDAELARVEETGFVSPEFLDHPVVGEVLAGLDRDLQRTSKQVQELKTARQLADPAVLQGILRVVPPPGGDPLDPWFPPAAAASGGVPNLPADVAQRIGAAWTALEAAWQRSDAPAANAALATLNETLPQVAPPLYPSQTRLGWEHWYYQNGKLTITWVVYLAALPFLLMATVYGFRWARWTGLFFFAGGFALHTFSTILRWYLAGRIPNSNMFEAIVASAWFGGLVALVLEVLLRRRPFRNLPALAAGTYAMTAMMVGHFLPVQLNSDIAPVMPVLDRTVWLYIHTNMVIASYALIFFAAVTALLYLLLRAGARFASAEGRFARAWTGPGGGSASPLLLAATGGGAGSVILGGLGGSRHFASGDATNAGLARTLDGATMIFLEVAFVLLWLGTILGAVWADVSWGRPWGWDPKEVFALNTWLVFLVLVHVRLKVRDKALWTAALALAGCAVMLFNWIAVNFVIVGLHSYA